jgi:uncharacterized protein involved in exopolysaccharide biosynthesis
MENKIPAWEQNKTHFQDYFFLLRKRLWLILACFVVTFSLAILYNSSQTPIYQASSTIQIHEKKDRVPLPNQQTYSYQDYAEKQRAFETHFKVLKSYPIIGEVVNRLNLRRVFNKPKKIERPQGFRALLMNLNRFTRAFLDRILIYQQKEKQNPSPEKVLTYDPVISAVQGSLTISPVVETNLANLICTHPDPVLAVQIANTLAEVYKDNIERKQTDLNRENFNWISEEIERLKKQLNHSEDELHKYKEKSKILSMETDKQIESQELSLLRAELNKTKAWKNELQAQIQELEKIIQQNQRHVPGFIKSEIIRNISNNLVRAQLELNKLSKTYKHKHPKIIKTKAHIASLEKQFFQELGKIIGGIKSQIQVLSSKEETLNVTLKKYREHAIRSTPKNVQFSRLHKETQTNTELYNYLIKQLKSLDIREKVKDQEISIVEWAKLPKAPIRPRKRMNLIMGAITGLTLGISLAFFIEYLDRSIKGIEDVERFLELPVLGVIPRFNKD